MTSIPKKYKISGTNKIPKDKAATKHYELFETDDIKEMADYINTHAVVPCELDGGYRLRANVKEIYPWIRLDVDKKGEAKKIDKALKKVTFIKKPSTNNAEFPYKWHYFVPVQNISQDYDGYKMQYYKFLSDHGIELSDKSLASVVQNTNPFKGSAEDANTLTLYHKKKVWKAPSVTVPKKKEHTEKHSDTSKKEVKKMLTKVDPDCSYSDWLQVGFALYDWCPKKGIKLFDEWSKGSDKYDGTTVDKWDDFSRNASGEVTLGTLVHMAYGEKLPEPTSLFKSEKGSVKPKKPLTDAEKKELKQEKKKKKEEFSILNIDGVMDENELERQANEVILFDGLIAEGYHTVLYGAAGSNKTTISAWACVQMLKEFQHKVVHYWAFDSDRIHNNEMFKFTIREGVRERFKLITQKDADFFKEYYNEARDNEYDLTNLVIVIDTYKFITTDVNNKSANKTVLHEIKKLQTLGASILTLSHANKDGANFSGTGELSQDTDALLVISREKDDNTGDITTTIKTETRSRFGVPIGGITLMSNGDGVKGAEYHEKIFGNLNRIENKFNTGGDISTEIFEKEKELENKAKLKEVEDKKYIKEISRIIKYLSESDNVHAIQSTILAEAQRESSLSKNLVSRILRDYDEVYWVWKEFKHSNNGKTTKKYKLLKPK